MPGHQHGDQLVADFLVAHGLAVFVAGRNQHGHDVGPRLRVFLPATGNFLVQQAVDLALQPLDPPPCRERPQVNLQAAHQKHRAAADQSQELDQQGADARQRVALFHPEHGAQDDVQGDPLHVSVNREHLPNRPAVDRAVRDLPHDVAVQAHALAVKRRHEQLALAPVPRAVKQKDRIGAEDGPQHPHRRRLAEQHERGSAEQAHRKHVAVGRGAGAHERYGPPYPLRHLKHSRHSGSGRQCGHG